MHVLTLQATQLAVVKVPEAMPQHTVIRVAPWICSAVMAIDAGGKQVQLRQWLYGVARTQW